MKAGAGKIVVVESDYALIDNADPTRRHPYFFE